MILFSFLPLELLLGPDHNLKTYSTLLHFQTTKSHNFSIIRNPYYFFFSFLSVQGPTTQIGPIGLGHNNDNDDNDGDGSGGGGDGDGGRRWRWALQIEEVGGEGGRYGKKASLVEAVAAGAVSAAVVQTAAVEDQGQPLVGFLVGSGGDDGSLQTCCMEDSQVVSDD